MVTRKNNGIMGRVSYSKKIDYEIDLNFYLSVKPWIHSQVHETWVYPKTKPIFVILRELYTLQSGKTFISTI